ncbi:MBL fold metallo-hydrolase [Planktomarina temperata]|nr:MBL fold metallo-hydrolase [Planktomarina temperata]
MSKEKTTQSKLDTQILFVNHASVQVSYKNVSILTDPWYSGRVFNEGWNLIVETTDEEATKVLTSTTHIWISHEHPDHFSVKFFKTFKNEIIDKKIKILFQKTEDKRVVMFLRSLGLDVIEIEFNKTVPLSKHTAIKCIKDGFYDSALLIENDSEKILNLNDCEVNTKNRAREVKNVTGNVDVLLTQFSYAAWKGGTNNKKWRKEAAEEKINTIALQIQTFNPKYLIPFASFIYFCNSENFYLNDSVNTPSDIAEKFTNNKQQVIIMKPGDILSVEKSSKLSTQAASYWRKQYESLDGRPTNTYDIVQVPELKQSFRKYISRIRQNNDMKVIKFLAKISPVSVFKDVEIYLTDVGQSATISLTSESLEIHQRKKPMLSMKAEMLNFMLNNSFGFDTLVVNGCFEQTNEGGFVTAAKTLAIENLNNLGIRIELRTLINYKIIKLFLTRLYRVARKLEA